MPLTALRSSSGPDLSPEKAWPSAVRAPARLSSGRSTTSTKITERVFSAAACPRRRPRWVVTQTTRAPPTWSPSTVEPVSTDHANSPVQWPSSGSSSVQQGHMRRQSQASTNVPFSR